MPATINRLGLEVLRRWRATGREPSAFAGIAHRALSEAIGPLIRSPAQWVRRIADLPTLPKQNLASKFGEPPVTLFARAGIAIDIYFWTHPATAIHDHLFCGAFGVLHGVSLHRTWQFDCPAPLDDGVRVGQLRPLASELLFVGDVRPIAAAPHLIHQVAHLAKPSVSVCVRTTADAPPPNQCVYFAPGLVAVLPKLLPAHSQRQLAMLAMLADAGHPETLAVAIELVDHADDALAFWLLWGLAQHGDMGLVLQALTDCRQRPWFDAVLPAQIELGQQVPPDLATGHGDGDDLGRLQRWLAGVPEAPALLHQYAERTPR